MEWILGAIALVLFATVIGAAFKGVDGAAIGLGCGLGIVILTGYVALIYWDIVAMIDAYSREAWGFAALWTVVLVFLLGGFGGGYASRSRS